MFCFVGRKSIECWAICKGLVGEQDMLSTEQDIKLTMRWSRDKPGGSRTTYGLWAPPSLQKQQSGTI